MKYKKWSIWRANLDPVIGSEQGKTRPVLIISENDINELLYFIEIVSGMIIICKSSVTIGIFSRFLKIPDELLFNELLITKIISNGPNLRETC